MGTGGDGTPTPEVRRARAFRRALEDLWLAVDLRHTRRGFVTGLAAEAGIKRGTIHTWFSETHPKEPGMDSFRALADYFGFTRVEIVAAFDGEPILTADRAEALGISEMWRQVEAAEAEGLLQLAHPRRRTAKPRGSAFPPRSAP